VINLGINTDVDAFLAAIGEHKPDIVGMSAMLTTTMPYMAVVIEALEEQGLRDQLLVLVGGAPLNEAFAEEIRADAYCRDAAVGVETAKKLMAIKRGQLN
jgi:5-methyltetrahydrofolate--homocysteine methyltransferase